MVWNLVVDGKIVAWVPMSDDDIAWLRPRLVDSRARSIDPYRDIRFDLDLVRVWLNELRRVLAGARAEKRTEVARAQRLPHDPAARERLLDDLVERDLARESRWRRVEEAISLLELADDGGGIIDARGD